jgi:hypothetical protein
MCVCVCVCVHMYVVCCVCLCVRKHANGEKTNVHTLSNIRPYAHINSLTFTAPRFFAVPVSQGSCVTAVIPSSSPQRKRGSERQQQCCSCHTQDDRLWVLCDFFFFFSRKNSGHHTILSFLKTFTHARRAISGIDVAGRRLQKRLRPDVGAS